MEKRTDELVKQDCCKEVDPTKVDQLVASLELKGDQKPLNWTREFTASGSGKGNGGGGNAANIGT